MTKTNAGNDIQWLQMFGVAAGETNTSTGTSATSLTRTGAGWTVDQWKGFLVVVGNTYGIVTTNSATVLTVDRWYAPGTPGGAAATTPGATSVYTIMPGAGAPAFFLGLSTSVAAVGAGDTTLASEITTVGGGLIRKQATIAHTAGASSGTLSATFTANGTDSLPVTVGKVGVSQSLLSGWNNLFQTLLGTTATLSASGDQLTVTDTVTM